MRRNVRRCGGKLPHLGNRWNDVPDQGRGVQGVPFVAVAFAALLAVVSACATVPVTGRQQINLVPTTQLLSLSADSYRKVLDEQPVSDDGVAKARVARVGNAIRAAVEEYMRSNGLQDQLKGYAWEFTLIQDDAINAWCMPGGKVVFYTGIMPVCQDDTGVAVVMGHEIAHAIARHGNERMSHGLLQQLGGVALSTALQQKPAETQELFMSLYGAGTQIGVMLPYSRLQESEADRLGLVFMAMAGYDPREAPAFWKRMEAAQSGNRPPEFLSTHPAPESRIKGLTAAMDDALKYFRPGER